MSSLSLQNMSISRKITVLVNVVGLITCVMVGAVAYLRASEGLSIAADEKLLAVVDARKVALEHWIGGIEGDLAIMAGSPTVRDALTAYQKAWLDLGLTPTETLQDLYIEKNPHPTGQKENLDAAPDGSLYSQIHANFHPYFRSFLRSRGYYDIFLFDARGNVVYTVFKEPDFATNVVNGKWKDTDLGRVFREARDNPKEGFIAFADFMPYPPSNNVPASFIAAPVLKDGQLIGVLAFQMPIGKLNEIMQNAEGLSDEGETYVVGEDLKMRSTSRFSEEEGADTMLQEMALDHVKAAFEVGADSDAVDHMRSLDRHGHEAETAFTTVEIAGQRWAIIAEEDMDAAFAYVHKLKREIILVTLGVAAILFFVGTFVGRSLAAPIIAMTEAMRRLAGGDTATQIPGTGRGDEIGKMASAVQVFKENMLEAEALKQQQIEAEKRAEEDKRRAMNDLANDFENRVGVIVEGVASASVEMQSGAGNLRKIAEQTNNRSASVASASEQASANVSTVAAAAEELSASISEVTQQIGNTVELAAKAVQEAEQTNATVEGLDASARKIGDVVNLIQEIAEQTNLLALNATIEAARAGDAGKGFAVVATEVKNLAGQTAKATEDIASQITEIQGVSRACVEAIGRIRTAIENINERVASVSAAAEEQNATTAEISRNVQQAAQGTQEVTANIVTVSNAAEETMGMAGDVNGAAEELSKKAEQLRHELQNFLTQVRSA